ncbi:ABC transporter ATP-binding protein [Haloprofundus halobius]|uniref:ABC transporter ATP-binding protein n=1 Tax=Haloprofundus halobius TaxID=2876194 RepID=UPI001CCA2DFA|nr:ABC transporter ATP-binding protein [Haloprofundus halobius]
MSELTLQELRKEYSDVVAVNNTNLKLEDGEFVSFVGPSGCGKSTTLGMISGLTRPTSGTVEIGGRDVTDDAPKDRGIAMVFQNIALFPHKSVYGNISFGLRMRGYESDEIDQRVDEAVEILQLEGMLNRMPDELSGGQRQRVAIGRALVRNPDVFLMDEPLANLDAKLRVHMRTEIQRIQRELDVTMVYVTHDQEEAMTMSDRIVVMDGGAVQQFAPPLECYNEPANQFVASFIGSPSMNFIDGVVTEDGLETPRFDIPLDTEQLALERKANVTLGIRPEDIYPSDKTAGQKEYSTPIQVTVDVTEPTGNRVMTYLLIGDENATGIHEVDELLMEVEPDTEIKEGDTLDVYLDRSKIHLFDESGDAIAHGTTREALEVTTVDESSKAEN